MVPVMIPIRLLLTVPMGLIMSGCLLASYEDSGGCFQELSITLSSESYRLPARIAMPCGRGPFAAAVFIHGSGPMDQDSTVGLNQPFRELANGLARRGIASIRYAKRTRFVSQPPPDADVRWEVITDAVTARARIEGQPRVDKRRIFYLGHSFGAYLLPRIAGVGSPPAGIISLAGFCRTPFINEHLSRYAGYSYFPKHYLADLKTYSPDAAARALSVPMLLLHGGADTQVPASELKRCRELLEGLPVRAIEYTGLNHFFQVEENLSDLFGNAAIRPMPETVFDDIARWIVAAPRRGSSSEALGGANGQ